ncbi:MAG: NYN domain-containing protein [Acidimicrobiales bacterium]|nr:NYN domain-containing protein [Acidimicrobiales bacterium]HRW37108.1 NYN domain-containing protein [Aquihabitans sp.]
MSDASAPGHRTTWFVDGSNVVGAGADGWWNDRTAAFARFATVLAGWTNAHEDQVVLVFDGASEPSIAVVAGGDLRIEFAPRRGRDAADDRIVELVEAHLGDPRRRDAEGVVVVTSDRGLADRLRSGVSVEGAGTFRRRLGLDVGGRPPRRGRS